MRKLAKLFNFKDITDLYCKNCKKLYTIGDTISKGNKCPKCDKRLIKSIKIIELAKVEWCSNCQQIKEINKRCTSCQI